MTDSFRQETQGQSEKVVLISSAETSISTICLPVSMMTDSFRQETLGQSERVVFDVLCGDFNIDNLSPGKYGDR